MGFICLLVLFYFLGIPVKPRTIGPFPTTSCTTAVEHRKKPTLSIDDEGSSHKNDLLPRIPEHRQSFKWNIQTPSNDKGLKHAVALLDTQCQRGNWVSSQFIKRIGKTSEVRIVWNAPLLQAAKGGFVTTQGQISLEWKRQQGNNFYETDFYVLPKDAMTFDVIFGAEFISENKLLTVNEHVMLPLLESKKNIGPGKLE